jgi:hypothetical protein
VAKIVQRLNPVEGPINEFLPKILVNNRPYSEYAHWLWTPEAFAGVMVMLLFLYAAFQLRIDARQR